MRVDWCVSSWFRIKNSLSLSPQCCSDRFAGPPPGRRRGDVHIGKLVFSYMNFKITLANLILLITTHQDHPHTIGSLCSPA